MSDNNTSPMSDGFVRPKDVAEFMAVSRCHVYRLMDAGKLPWVQIGDARRIPTKAVVEYINRNYNPATRIEVR